MKILWLASRRVILVVVVAVGIWAGPRLSELIAFAQNITYTPATRAFENNPGFGCSTTDLSVSSDLARGNPEWKVIVIDPNLPPILQGDPLSLLKNPPTILEGIVPPPPPNEGSADQAPSEVAEEDLPWNHYTHDLTFKVVPDDPYKHLLSSYEIPAGQTCEDGTAGPTTCHHTDMEVEWENASLMDVQGDQNAFQRTWGAIPEFVWPAVGDRVWVEGRWIFDCGHPNTGSTGETALVQFSTEIHPPRALVTLRLNHPALDSFPVPRTSAPNFPFPQSYLPVTGEPVTLPPGVPNSGPTNVPVTEADIFVSGNGGGANDLCSLTQNSGDECDRGHTNPVIPVKDRNYVFDIYPPGTNYESFLANGSFRVTPPVPDAALQWRTVDHSSELPAHACGGTDTTGCVTVDPMFCLIDAATPPPDPNDTIQKDASCPSAPARPTRLRVILPFLGSNANFFAQSILLGWDDVPGPPPQILLAFAGTSANLFAQSSLLGQVGLPGPLTTPPVRTFKVTLHALTVVKNGENCVVDPLSCDGDWRVFVGVAGQWRYISPLFETDDGSIHLFSDAENICHGTALTENGDGDCFVFDNTPWKVSVQDGTPIHVSVGGWESDRIDSHFCSTYPGGCDPFSPGDVTALATANNDRIGTYEFDLKAPDYAWADAPSFTTKESACIKFEIIGIPISTCDELQYKVEFRVEEIRPATAPSSAPLVIGLPNFTGPPGIFITPATPMIPQTADPNAEGFQYRFHHQGASLPTYPSSQPFPVHWAHADLAPGVHSVEVRIDGANSGDGPYDFQYSAESFGNLLEPRHTVTVILDSTPPVITIVQPQPTAYPHSATLTLDYTVSDGNGSGVQSFTPLMDGATTLPDGTTGFASGQTINLLLTGMSLGTHTFSINAVDNINNAATKSVTFSIVVTPESIKQDVNLFVAAGKITVDAGSSLLNLLDAAADARAAGDCNTANLLYEAFINQLTALSGKKVDATAAQLMIQDAEYLIAHCP